MTSFPSSLLSRVVLVITTVFAYIVHVSRAQSVPAMYVFGDSLVDVGNNNHLALSILKADFPYNGIDFPGHQATGRFSNGKNAADFLAEKVGIASPPPYLSKPNNVFVKGVSFASGGAGIFNQTDENLIKRTIPLTHQVGHFSTVRQRLAKELGPDAVQEHLSKSLFPIVIGSNDIINYFNPNSDVSVKSSPQEYVASMVTTLKDLLKGLYGLGARKFLVGGLPPIGCTPKQRYANLSNECNSEVNYWTNKYNLELTQMLPQLKSELKPDFHYVFFDTYALFTDLIRNPQSYGFNEIKAACCGLGRLRAKIPCTPVSLFCANRNEHLFWDIYHPTEAAARILINKLFSAQPDQVYPITVQQLIIA